jgi:hypothetical protein
LVSVCVLAGVTLLLSCNCTYLCLCCTSCALRALNNIFSCSKKKKNYNKYNET